jgi:teichuronic acid biosynthesis glycosyltransferase TuaG
MEISGSISVIIPTWNRAGTITKAVQSALSQTLPPLEVLVCDDCSTDDSAERVRALNDPRVKWLPGEHIGQAFTRNRGIAAAQGEWLAFLDSDDVWLPEKLERQMRQVEASGHLACCTDAWRIAPGRPERRLYLGGESRVIDFGFLLKCNHVICSSALVHSCLFDTVEGFPNLKAWEDYALWLRILCLTQFDYISLPLLEYTDDPVNSLRAEDRSECVERCMVIGDLIAWLRRARPQKAGIFLRSSRMARLKWNVVHLLNATAYTRPILYYEQRAKFHFLRVVKWMIQ